MAQLRLEILLFLMLALAGTCTWARKEYDFKDVNKLIRQEQCNVPPSRRINCGWGGITKERCERKGCCFNDKIYGTIWCYYLNTAMKGVCVLMDRVRDGYVGEDEMKQAGVDYADVSFFDLDGDRKFTKPECFALQMVVESDWSKGKVNWFKYYDKNGDGKLTKDELIQGDPNGDDENVQKKISSVLRWVGGMDDKDETSLNFIEFYQAWRQGPDNQQLYHPKSI